MSPRTVVAAAIVMLAVACTNGTTTTSVASPGATTSQPTSDVIANIVPGEWTYSLYDVKATFTWKDGPPTLAVKNDSDLPLGAPSLYIVTRDQRHVEGKVADAAPLDPSASARYTVTFPSDLRSDDVGLVVLELGDENWGALSPKVEGG